MEEILKGLIDKQPHELTGETKKLFEAIMKIADERDQLKRDFEIKNNYLELLCDIGYDYDGCNTVESLKELIDELIKFAELALKNNDKEVMYIGANEQKYNILHEKIEC